MPLRKNFLIVCEGEKTEPEYFTSFRVPKTILDIHGLGANTESLVRETIRIRDSDSTIYNEVWCVFDRDSFPIENFNNALMLAKNNNINVAYSNEAFEIWYLLHFYYHDAATSRTQYESMLTHRLGFQYKKNDPKIYDHLIPSQANAIKNAKRLISSYSSHRPGHDNPSTTVYELVEKLNFHSS